MSYYSYKSKQQQFAQQQAAWQAYLRMDPMNCIIDPQGSKGGLYLGNIDAAQNIDMLRRHNIGAVLTVAARTGLKYDRSHQITHQVIHADDVESYDLSRHFPVLLDFIEQNIQHTNVLVHCFAGVSRSATTVIAYLMKTNNWTYEKSMFYCKARRKVTNPNTGFIRQLLSFEKRLREKQSTSFYVNQPDQASVSQSMFYQGQGPVRVLPQSSHSNRNENPLADNTPSKSGKKNLSMTMNSFKPQSYFDQNTPVGRGYGSASTVQVDPSSMFKSNYHEQTLARSTVKPAVFGEQIRSQSSQANRITDTSPHFGGNIKGNQIDNNNSLFTSAYGATVKSPMNETKTISYGTINQRQNDRTNYKDRSSSSQPLYSQQVHPSGLDYGVEQRGLDRGSSVRQSSAFQNNQSAQSHFQNQQNYTNSLRNSYQKAPSYVVGQQAPKTIYGTSFMNLNKAESRPYQYLNSQVTPQSIYASSYGVGSKNVGYNPKYYPTRRALFTDKPLF